MSAKVVLLSGAPVYAPGILYKIFQDIEGVETFYRPFLPNLDLIAGYSVVLRGEPGVPPGYFDSYSRYPNLFRKYPGTSKAAAETLRTFLEACRNCGATSVVFDMSGDEDGVPHLLELWPDAVLITLGDSTLPKNARRVKNVTEKELLSDYPSSAISILQFCGIENQALNSVSLNSDWLNLSYKNKKLEFRHPVAYAGFGITRLALEKLLLQTQVILEQGRKQCEIVSLQTQLALVQQAADERLDLIHKLTAKVDK